MKSGIGNLYEFDRFRFDGEGGKLWQNDDLVLLSPKVTQLLDCLLEKRGEFVSKEEIFNRVWADTFVEDGVLTQNIYTLRKALGTSSDGLPIIENKSRLGYRITVPINISIDQTNGFHKSENNGYTDSQANTFDLNADTTTKSELTQLPAQSLPNKNDSGKKFLLLSIGLILLAATAFLVWRFSHSNLTTVFRVPGEPLKFTQLTNTGDLINAAISPDSSFLAFTRGNKIYLKDIGSDKEISLEIPNASAYSSLQFSGDGNFLYFRNAKSAHTFAQILKTSRFGGEAQIIAEKSYATFSLSPDNKFLAYYSVEMPDVSMRLLVKNLETKEMREIFASGKSSSAAQNCIPAWSPDGKKILHVNQLPGNQPSQLFLIDVATGDKEEIKLPKLRRFEQAAWLPDGKGFVISATEYGRFFHLWKVAYPKGDYEPITNGLSSYKNVIVSADGKKLMALHSAETSNIYLALVANLDEQEPITTGNSNNFGQGALNWIDEKTLFFSSQNDRELVENLWSIGIDGSARQQITNEREYSVTTPSSDGKHIYYSVNRNGVTNISRVDLSGEELTELTSEKDGVRRSPQISPAGDWAYYIFRNQSGVKILRRNLLDLKEEVFLEDAKIQCGTFLAISPDGKYLACPNWRSQGSENSEKPSFEIAVFSTENKNDIRLLQLAGSSLFRFSPDSKGIDFLAPFEEGSRIMRQTLADGDTKTILQTPKSRIFNFAWSKTGKQLALSSGQSSKDVVLLTNF